MKKLHRARKQKTVKRRKPVKKHRGDAAVLAEQLATTKSPWPQITDQSQTCDFKEYPHPDPSHSLVTDRQKIESCKERWDWKVLRYFQSSFYRVSFYIQPVEENRPWPMGLLSYRRKDGKVIVGWREKLLIKDCIAGTESEAVEIFPHHARLLDMANQSHLWVMPGNQMVPFGYRNPRLTEQDPIVQKHLHEAIDAKRATPQAERLSRHNYTDDAGFGPHGLLGKWWETVETNTTTNQGS